MASGEYDPLSTPNDAGQKAPVVCPPATAAARVADRIIFGVLEDKKPHTWNDVNIPGASRKGLPQIGRYDLVIPCLNVPVLFHTIVGQVASFIASKSFPELVDLCPEHVGNDLVEAGRRIQKAYEEKNSGSRPGT